MTHNLLKGFKAFHEKYYEGPAPLMKELVAEGQDPDYFIISCIDSRTNPGMLFSPKPGTFFAHKAMGAIVRPYHQGTALAAALHYALDYNDIHEIIVMAHTGCGAVEALVEKLDDEEISSFINVARGALKKAKACPHNDGSHDKLLRLTEEYILLESVENLKGYPAVARALAEERVKIVPWMFDMHSGDLLEYDFKDESFHKINE